MMTRLADLIILVDTAYDEYEKFHKYLDNLTDDISQGLFTSKAMWVMGFHPEGDDNDNLEGENFEPLIEEEYGSYLCTETNCNYKSQQKKLRN